MGEVEEEAALTAHASQIVGLDQGGDDGIREQHRVAIAEEDGPDLEADEPVAADDGVDGRNADAVEVDGIGRPILHGEGRLDGHHRRPSPPSGCNGQRADRSREADDRVPGSRRSPRASTRYHPGALPQSQPRPNRCVTPRSLTAAKA